MNTTEELITSFLQRISGGDADAIAELFSEDIDWYVAGNPGLPWIGRRSRRAEVAAYFHTLWPQFEPGTQKASVQRIVVTGEDGVAFISVGATAVSTGRAFLTPMAIHIRVVAGKIVQMHLYEDSWAVSKAFFD
jgi:uncharacterized protein